MRRLRPRAIPRPLTLIGECGLTPKQTMIRNRLINGESTQLRPCCAHAIAGKENMIDFKEIFAGVSRLPAPTVGVRRLREASGNLIEVLFISLIGLMKIARSVQTSDRTNEFDRGSSSTLCRALR